MPLAICHIACITQAISRCVFDGSLLIATGIEWHHHVSAVVILRMRNSRNHGDSCHQKREGTWLKADYPPERISINAVHTRELIFEFQKLLADEARRCSSLTCSTTRWISINKEGTIVAVYTKSGVSWCLSFQMKRRAFSFGRFEESSLDALIETGRFLWKTARLRTFPASDSARQFIGQTFNYLADLN